MCRRRDGDGRGGRERPESSIPTIRSRGSSTQRTRRPCREREIDLEYDTLENLFSWPGDQTPNVRAQNLNTIDEVPDSTWFTNRLGTVPVTVDELVKGPGSGTGPAPGGWTVISAKNDGVMPGFTVRDSAGQVWFIKFDPPGYPAMATGTEVLVARLFWGLGYHVPETHLATLRPEELTIDDQARIKSPSGNRRRFKESDIRLLLRRAHRESDGSYRVVASKALEGRPVGGFRFYGTRSDDPNDVIPHEHRRELRGYGTFSAWLNHVDSKSINTLDTVVEQDGKQVVRHHLLDFGSTIGSAGVYAREAYEGWEYSRRARRRWPACRAWGSTSRTGGRSRCIVQNPSAPSPLTTRSGTPSGGNPATRNSAFRSARLDDKFWAARRLQAFTDEMLNTLIGVGQFNDPKSEEMLSKFLIERRNAILRRYLPAVNPVVDVRLSPSGTLTFRNAAVDADVAHAPKEYVVAWQRFDNATGTTTNLGETRASATNVNAPKDLPAAAGTYIRVEISANGGPESWTEPAHAYFRREAAGWTLVGFERVPGGNPPGSKGASRRTN